MRDIEQTYKKLITQWNSRRNGDWDDEGPVRKPGAYWNRSAWERQMSEERQRLRKEVAGAKLAKEIEQNPSLLDDDKIWYELNKNWSYLPYQFRMKYHDRYAKWNEQFFKKNVARIRGK